MKAFLIIEKGEPYNKSRVVTLPGKRILIGKRAKGVVPGVSFTSPYISRRHAELKYADNKFYLTDLPTSKHGTSINGKKLSAGRPYVLKHSDRVSLAHNEAVFVFCSEDSTLDFANQRSPISVLFDKNKKKVIVDDRTYVVTGHNLTLFSLLYKKRNRLVSESAIRRAVWPNKCFEKTPEDARTEISRLKNALGSDKNIITTTRGCGYMLTVDE